MGEMVLSVVAFAERGGKPAAIGLLLLGLALVPLGLWLTFVMPGEAPPDAGPIAHAHVGDRLMSPIMLVVSAAGLGLMGLGAGSLFGAQRKLDAFEEDAAPPPRDAAKLSREIDAASLPFWVCGDCRVLETGVSTTDRCTECGNISGFVAVAEESDRAMARSIIG